MRQCKMIWFCSIKFILILSCGQSVAMKRRLKGKARARRRQSRSHGNRRSTQPIWDGITFSHWSLVLWMRSKLQCQLTVVSEVQCLVTSPMRFLLLSTHDVHCPFTGCLSSLYCPLHTLQWTTNPRGFSRSYEVISFMFVIVSSVLCIL